MPPKVKNPCIKCGESVTTNSIACCVCARWIHAKCADMPKEMFNHLLENKKAHGHHFWGCEGCSKGVYEFSVQVQRLKLDLNSVKKQVEDNTASLETVKDKVKSLEKKVEESSNERTQDREGILKEARSSWSAELRDREARRGNIVVHNLPEPPADLTAPAKRKEKDQDALMALLADIGININKDEDIKFSVRPGKVSEDAGSKPRPLIVGFRSHALRDKVLDNARKLKHSNLFSRVSLVPDLTNQQRQEDKELQQEADKLNRELESEGNLNFQYRCQGRKGERILVKGKVTEDWPRRTTTGANSLPLGTTRRGRISLNEVNLEDNTSEDEEEVEEVEAEEEEGEGEEDEVGEEGREREETRTKRKAPNSPQTSLSQESRKGKKTKKNPRTP